MQKNETALHFHKMEFSMLGRDIWNLIGVCCYNQAIAGNDSSARVLSRYARANRILYECCRPLLNDMREHYIELYDRKIPTLDDLSAEYIPETKILEKAINLYCMLHKYRLAVYARATGNRDDRYTDLFIFIAKFEEISNGSAEFKRACKRFRRVAIKIRAITGEDCARIMGSIYEKFSI